MDLLSSQIAHLQTQVQLLPSLVSTVARLSSVHDRLSKINEDQARIIAELSRAVFPEGCWIWEGGDETFEGTRREAEKGGRWVWSLEKYKPLTPKARTGAPASLESLPVELLDLVISFLPRSDQLTFSRCSLRILTRVVDAVYGSTLVLDSRNAAAFISARITDPSLSSPRIRSLLLPSTLHLRCKDFHASYLLPLLNLNLDHLLPPLEIQNVVLILNALFPSPLAKWSPLLRLLNPRTLSFSGRSSAASQSQSHSHVAASTAPVSPNDLACTYGWTRLSTFWAYGAQSVPMVENRQRGGVSFALGRSLMRGRGGGGGDASLSFELVSPLLDGGKEREVVEEWKLVEKLGKVPKGSEGRVRKGAYLRVTVVGKG